MSNDKPKTFFNQQEPIIKQDPHGSILFFLFVCVSVPCGMWDLSSPTRDRIQNSSPLQWKRRVLTTGPPGKPLNSQNWQNWIQIHSTWSQDSEFIKTQLMQFPLWLKLPPMLELLESSRSLSTLRLKLDRHGKHKPPSLAGKAARAEGVGLQLTHEDITRSVSIQRDLLNSSSLKKKRPQI